MTLPSRPIRKSAQAGVTAQGKPVSGQNKAVYARKSAQAFGSVSKSVYERQGPGVSPSSLPVNDKDGGKALKTGVSRVPRMKGAD